MKPRHDYFVHLVTTSVQLHRTNKLSVNAFVDLCNWSFWGTVTVQRKKKSQLLTDTTEKYST